MQISGGGSRLCLKFLQTLSNSVHGNIPNIFLYILACTQVMKSRPMQLAMIISAIMFTQTSVLNYLYFLNNVLKVIGVL